MASCRLKAATEMWNAYMTRPGYVANFSKVLTTLYPTAMRTMQLSTFSPASPCKSSSGSRALLLLKAALPVAAPFERRTSATACINGPQKCFLIITAATDKTVTTEFTVTEELTNMGGTLHGGASATIADVVSTLGLMLTAQNRPGVSVNLSMNYLKGAKVGETVEVHSETLRVGKTLAYLDVKIRKKDTGELVAIGTHVKHMGS